MIGRQDVILQGPNVRSNVTDLILRVCREYWREGFFQDADSHEAYSLGDERVWTTGTQSREFFIFRDKSVIGEWQRRGVFAEQPNSMLHFLLRTPNGDSAPTEITLVCDSLDENVGSLISSLNSAFVCAMSEQQALAA